MHYDYTLTRIFEFNETGLEMIDGDKRYKNIMKDLIECTAA
jgi:hypothetical protein